MGAIVIEGVSKRFRLQTDKAHSVKELVTRRDRSADANHFWALRDVSFEIPEGSMYALVGHNGSGKSTLLRCIAGIYRPSEGQVTVSGRISTLLELGAGFHPDLTGRENVYMNATILGMSRKQIDQSFDEIVEFAGVQDFIDSPVKIYSSGMYVRLGFSVAVHVDPEILIVDEVIAVGDAEFQRKCFDHLFDLRRRGTTIVVVTHGLSTVENMCDGAAWLDHGELQMTGTGPEVVAGYLHRVNEAERREREAEREALRVVRREQEAAEVAEGAAGSVEAGADGAEAQVADAEPEGTDEPLPPAREDVWVDRVEFLGADGEVAPFALHREPFTVRIWFEASQPVQRPVVGVAVHTANDVHVAGTNTKIDGVDLVVLEGRGHVDFTVDRLALTPGEYELSVVIADEFVQHDYDKRPREWRFSVREGSGQAPVGLTDLMGDWTGPVAGTPTEEGGR